MARFNQAALITGRPSTSKPDLHNSAVRAALADGLAAYATKHPTTGEPMLFTSKDRRRARMAKQRAEAR